MTNLKQAILQGIPSELPENKKFCNNSLTICCDNDPAFFEDAVCYYGEPSTLKD